MRLERIGPRGYSEFDSLAAHYWVLVLLWQGDGISRHAKLKPYWVWRSLQFPAMRLIFIRMLHDKKWMPTMFVRGYLK